jgi:hypothetical protein
MASSDAPSPSQSVITPRLDEQVVAEAECTELSQSAAAWGIVSADAELATYADAFIATQVTQLCSNYTYVWTAPIRRCFADAATAAEIAACKAMLAPRDLPDLMDEVNEVQGRVERIAKLKSTADCAAVVSSHYGNIAWQPYLPKRLSAATRKRLISNARSALSKACIGENWSATTRACISEAEGREPGVEPSVHDERDQRRIECFDVMGQTWPYPPMATFVTLGRCRRAAQVAPNLVCSVPDLAYPGPENRPYEDGLVAQFGLELIASCESRRWKGKTLQCLDKAEDDVDVFKCLRLEPDDQLLYENIRDDRCSTGGIEVDE